MRAPLLLTLASLMLAIVVATARTTRQSTWAGHPSTYSVVILRVLQSV